MSVQSVELRRRDLLGYIGASILAHIAFIVWFVLIGASLFFVSGGPMGIGGGADMIFQLAAGEEGFEVIEEEMAVDQDFDLTTDEEMAPEVVIEEEPEAIPVVPTEKPEPKPEVKVAEKPPQPKVGEKGDAPDSKKNIAGNALTGETMSSRFTGRTLHLLAGRLDVPSGNRLMDLRIHLFPDGTSRIKLTYFHYQTYHQQVQSTRALKGDGKWWIEGDQFCHKAMVINYGATDCFNLYEMKDGALELYYSDCDRNSSTWCKTNRIGARGRLESGIE